MEAVLLTHNPFHQLQPHSLSSTLLTGPSVTTAYAGGAAPEAPRRSAASRRGLRGIPEVVTDGELHLTSFFLFFTLGIFPSFIFLGFFFFGCGLRESFSEKKPPRGARGTVLRSPSSSSSGHTETKTSSALAGTEATCCWSPAAFRPPSADDSTDAAQTLPKRYITTKRHGQDPRRDAAARLALFPRLSVSSQSVLSRADGPEGMKYAALVSERQSADTRPAVGRSPGQPE
ncbi:hypothetical protein EYF80_048565 [Liparis tanakae]|uniref:Transmembrane protein n=1 Tax=Liparis tanakae TaxID=230148 RepID=A0A4Z2FJ76_9TELE|nr:hypothetical protein EYF80_048565 [Liparis tanakae]